jgi:hypothetical protein
MEKLRGKKQLTNLRCSVQFGQKHKVEKGCGSKTERGWEVGKGETGEVNTSQGALQMILRSWNFFPEGNLEMPITLVSVKSGLKEQN